MSDVWHEGWWMASDGKWYPPERHPDSVAPTTTPPHGAWQPPGSMPATSPAPVTSPLPPQAPAASTAAVEDSRPILKTWSFWSAAVVVVVLIAIAAALGTTAATGAGHKIAGAPSRSTSAIHPRRTATAASVDTRAPATPVRTPAPATAAGSSVSVGGQGTFLVGRDISSGTYTTTGGSNCYWEREGPVNGNPIGILANGNVVGNNVVTVLPTDREFVTAGCGTWAPLPPYGPQATTFGDGIWAVGIQIAPGTYTAPGGTNCFWKTESDLTGDGTAVLAEGSPKGPVTVVIAPVDKGFLTQRCGTWTQA